jgi:hypothetical protein
MNLDECLLSKFEDRYEFPTRTGDLLTSAIERYLKETHLDLTFKSEMRHLAEVLDKMLVDDLKTPYDRFIAQVYSLYLKNPSLYVFSNDRIQAVSEHAPQLIALIDRELITTNETSLLQGSFLFLAPCNALMFLSNISALICPRICESIDRVLLNLTEKTFGLPPDHTENPTERFRKRQSFFRIIVHQELFTIIGACNESAKEILLPRKDGSYVTLVHEIHEYIEKEVEITEEIFGLQDARTKNPPLVIDPMLSEAEQDRQYQMVINHATQKMKLSLEEFISRTSQQEKKQRLPALLDLISIFQHTLQDSLREILLVGSQVYDPQSLEDSLREILPQLLLQGELSELEKDLLVCFMPAGLFSFDEALHFWRNEYSGKRESYLESWKRVQAFLKKAYVSVEKDKEKEYKILISSICTPLRSISSIGIISYEQVCEHLGIDQSYWKKYSYLDLQAAMNTFLIQEDELFYDNIILFSS